MNSNIKRIGLIKRKKETISVIPYSEAALKMHFLEGRLVKPEWSKWHVPAPFLTAKPNLFLLLEPSSLPLQEIQSLLLLRFVLFGLRADFSISSSYRVISTPAPHSLYAADSLPDSNCAPVGAYVLQEVLFSTPKFPALLYGFIFYCRCPSWSFWLFFFLSLPTLILGVLTSSNTNFLYDSIWTNLVVKDCNDKYLHLFILTKMLVYIHIILTVHHLSNLSKNCFGELHCILHL